MGTVNQINACDDTANNFQIALVDQRVGNVSLPFQHREFGVEFDVIKRYYEDIGGDAAFYMYGIAQAFSTTQAYLHIFYSQKRAIPTVAVSANSHFAVADAAGSLAAMSALTIDQMGLTAARFIVTRTGGGLVAGNAAQVLANNELASRITISAEL